MNKDKKIDKQTWIKMFTCIANLMHEHKDELSAIDAKFGDGDHGITINKISDAINKEVSIWSNNDDTLKTFFERIGNTITNINGGSAGPLYGTYFSGLKEILTDEVETDGILLKKILVAGLEELQSITNAKVGDKTMMDTLIPATKAAASSNDDIINILTNAKEAALAGAEKSKDFISKFGRAKSYKEQTIGTVDAGALSCTYIFMGFLEGIK